jgi:hypothetical protein
MDKTNTSEIIVEQAKNTITSMQNLKQRAHKKNKERADLFEKLCANEHSFRVYTYMDPNLGQLKVVQTFLEKVEWFSGFFTGVNTEFDQVVDQKLVDEAYKESMDAYQNLVHELA